MKTDERPKVGMEVPRTEAPLGTPAVVLCLGGILLLFGVLALNGMVD